MRHRLSGPIVAVGFAAAVAGCATTAAGPEPQDYTRTVGDTYAGKHVSRMTARYGAPLRQQEVAGELVYTWERTRTQHWSTGPETYRCQLDAYVLPNGTVRTIGFSGQLGGCDAFMP
jgi:hypothetical protein